MIPASRCQAAGKEQEILFDDADGHQAALERITAARIGEGFFNDQRGMP